ncbi:hypothetical protein HUS23_13430 [Ectothiorhodospiraceae bacterium 2226]|nr:hypothetical protein HUS23_13430 [Ectothiorhodospiraceae bacterium 2226]
MAENIREKTDAAKEHMKEIPQDVKKEVDLNQMQSELAQLRNEFAQISATMRDIAANRTDAAMQNLREAAGRAQDQARVTAERVQAQIEERPVASVLTSFGVGLLLGILLDRRS